MVPLSDLDVNVLDAFNVPAETKYRYIHQGPGYHKSGNDPHKYFLNVHQKKTAAML
jgi:hypothetical protein